jgi:elongator complex protein 2
MKLVSASMDRTMILWEPDPISGLWIEKVRVGDIGGNHLGFFGAAFGKEGRYILAHGYNGAFHLWKNKSFISTKSDISRFFFRDFVSFIIYFNNTNK